MNRSYRPAPPLRNRKDWYVYQRSNKHYASMREYNGVCEATHPFARRLYDQRMEDKIRVDWRKHQQRNNSRHIEICSHSYMDR